MVPDDRRVALAVAYRGVGEGTNGDRAADGIYGRAAGAWKRPYGRQSSALMEPGIVVRVWEATTTGGLTENLGAPSGSSPTTGPSRLATT